MNNRDHLKTWANREIKAGRQIPWIVAFAISSPNRAQIREWFDECPPGLSKADTVDWLVREAMEVVGRMDAERAAEATNG